jgi:hypothetical protein
MRRAAFLAFMVVLAGRRLTFRHHWLVVSLAA